MICGIRATGGGGSIVAEMPEAGNLHLGDRLRGQIRPGQCPDARDCPRRFTPYGGLMRPSWPCLLPPLQILARPCAPRPTSQVLSWPLDNKGSAQLSSLSPSCRSPDVADHSVYVTLWPPVRRKRSGCPLRPSSIPQRRLAAPRSSDRSDLGGRPKTATIQATFCEENLLSFTKKRF